MKDSKRSTLSPSFSKMNMMSETLSSLNSETLTAAVNSLIQKPLPDSDQATQQLTETLKEPSEKVKKKKHSRLSRQLTTSKSREFSSAKNEIPNKNETVKESCPAVKALSESVSHKGYKMANSEQNKSCHPQRKHLLKESLARKKKPLKQTVSRHVKKPFAEDCSADKLSGAGQNNLINSDSTLQELLSKQKSQDLYKNVDHMHNSFSYVNNQTMNHLPEVPETCPDSCANKSFKIQEGNLPENVSPVVTAITPRLLVPGFSDSGRQSVAKITTLADVTPYVHVALSSQSHSSPVSATSLPSSHSFTDPTPVTMIHHSSSTPWVPHRLTDGMVPMLSLGPGLNIPLTVRPANNQLISALLSRFPTILPKPDMTKPGPEPKQDKPISITVSETPISEIHQNQMVAITTSGAAVISPVSRPPANSSVSSQYVNDLLITPSISHLPLGDPTGMEIQSLMNIVYGHLMEKDHTGRLTTPGSSVLDSSFRNQLVSYETVSPQNNHQSEATILSTNQSGSDKVMPPYRCSVVSSQDSQSRVALESHDEHMVNQPLMNQSAMGNSQRQVITYQPHIQTIESMTDNVDQPEITHQHCFPSQPQQPHFNHSNIPPDQLVHQPYIEPNQQQQPPELCHQSVISHTEHPPHNETYGYTRPPISTSTCMYLQHNMGQIDRQDDAQGLCRHNVNKDGVSFHDIVGSNQLHVLSRKNEQLPNSASVGRYDSDNLTRLQHYNITQIDNSEQDYQPETVNSASLPLSKQLEPRNIQEYTEEPPSENNVALREETYCLDCNRQLEKPCQVHNTEYSYIEDTPLLSRARASLPHCFYLRETEAAVYKSLGVWCKETVKQRTKFGPVIGPYRTLQRGETHTEDLHFNPYQVFERDKGTIYEMTDEDSCNWMMFVRLATTLQNQNCVLYQQERELFILTKKALQKDAELLMWFSSDICLRLKVSEDPSISKLVQCTTCGLYFTSKKLLRSHNKMTHPSFGKESWTCFICDKSYSSRTKLNLHTMIHMGLKPHRCVYCNKEFTDHSNLKVHQYIHTGLKKHKCTLCNRTFRQKAHLNSHLITHTGEKNAKCNYCDKTFARQSDCKVHEYNHTKERVYNCDVCRKVFYKLQSYKRHQKVHTGERNYMCNKCFKGFHTKYHRDRHLKICKEKGGKESSYMSLEEVANLDSTCDAVPLTVKAHEVAAENQSNGENRHQFQNSMFDT